MNFELNPRSLNPYYSPIMVELNVVGIHAWDVGGVLFPDNPTETTPPNRPLVDLARKIGRVWGDGSGYVIANTNRKENYYKDGKLLKDFGVFEETGIPEDDEHFLQCNGPDAKGDKLHNLIDRAATVPPTKPRVTSLIVDNRFRAVRFVPADVHKFVVNGKDSKEFGVEDWLAQVHPRLYRINGEIEDIAKEIAARFLQIHMDNLKRVAQFQRRRISKAGPLASMYHDEVKRVMDIFQFTESILPQDLLHLF